MLRGNNIELRPIKRSDLKDLNRWKNDYDIFKNLGGGYSPQSIDEQEGYIDKIINNSGNSKRFIISKDNKPIGSIGLYNINWINRNCELGIYIGEKDEWGKGYAREACQLIHEFAFNVLNLKKIKLNVLENNNGAIKMYNALGYKEVGRFIEDRYVKGKYKDVILMEYFGGK